MFIQRPAASRRFRKMASVVAALAVMLLVATPLSRAATALNVSATALAATGPGATQLTATGPAAASDSDAGAGERLNADAVERLIALGIIRGYEDGTIRPASPVTRAELAALLIRSLGLDNLATLGARDPGFPDVGPACQWAHGYIALVADRGLLTADPDGRFRPADGVTTAEAVTAVLRALGRERLIDPASAWPEGQLTLADAYGLGHIRELAGNIATRSDVAGILAAALRLSIMEVGADGTLVNTGTSFLSRQTPGALVADGDVAGTLSWYDGRYLIETATGLVAAAPGDATGLIADSTRLLLNGEDVDELRLRQAICEPGTIALATVYVDAGTGRGTMMSVSTYDGQPTYMQPLLAVSGGSISVASGSGSGIGSREYRLAADVWVLRNGAWTDPGALRAGDYVSFRTDHSGEVVFINAVEDADGPQFLGVRGKSGTRQLLLLVDEALAPASVTLTIDGRQYSQVNSPSAPVLSDGEFWLAYRQDLSFDQGRQLIITGPLGPGPHEIVVTGCDHAGNRFEQTIAAAGD
ncbi:MAG: S-layer homology domain-containing protein [Chloroflexota bacterium]